MVPPVEAGLRVAIAALSALVFLVGILAYVRRPTTRMLLVLALFAIFLVQGALLLWEVAAGDTTVIQELYYAFQLVEIGLVAAIILKR